MADAHVIRIEPAMAVMTPLALASFSHHIFNMCSDYGTENKGFLAQSYLFCVSIELGLKAAIVAIDCNDESKKLIKSLGHDLIAVHDCFKKHYQKQIFDQSDFDVLESVNAHYHRKGMEYFSPQVMLSMMRAYKDFSSLEELHQTAAKLNGFLNENELFVEANTTTKAKRGIITFI